MAALVIYAAPALAQTPSVTWQHVVPMNGVRGQINALQLAPNGDIVVAGHIPKPGSGSGRAQTDAWVARFSADGRELWSKTLGGPVRDEALALDVDTDGSVLMSGWRDIQEIRSWFAFAAKFSANGGLLWETTLRDDWRRTIALEIRATHDGGALIAGEEKRGKEPGAWPLVVSLDRDGDIEWRATPVPPRDPDAPPLPWGKMEDVAYGRTFSSLGRQNEQTIEVVNRAGYSPAPTVSACLVISLADGANTSDACPLLPRRSEEATFVGSSTRNFDASDARVIKVSSDGAELWRAERQTPIGDGINAVAPTADGGVVAAGYQLTSDRVERHNWDALLIRYDADGREIWRRVFGGSKRDEFNGIAALPDGSIVVAGYTGSQAPAEDWAPWLMRLNSQGELEGEALTQLKERQF